MREKLVMTRAIAWVFNLGIYENDMSDKPTAAWYLAPIFLGIIGSFIMWYVLKDEDHPDSPKMIKKGWVIGIVLTVLSIGWMIPFTVIGIFA